MLKEKKILEDFDLIKNLEDKDAEVICGGALTVTNATSELQSFFWIDHKTATAKLESLIPNNNVALTGQADQLFIVWDQQKGQGVDLIGNNFFKDGAVFLVEEDNKINLRPAFRKLTL